ncbi:MAG: PEP-CTERM sorting domain-containing protein [Verrucomicrobiales bacterium]
MKSPALLCVLIGWLQCAAQAAAVVGTSHMASDYIGPNSFTIDQDFASTDFTGFVFNAFGGSTFEYGGSFLDEGVSLFFVDANEAFSESNILGAAFTEVSFGTVYTLPQDFFLGIRTPALEVDFGPFSPAYGWAEIQNPGTGELLLVDHAVAYGGQGIFVDTLTPIPEPNSLALALVGLGFILLKMRRRIRCR